MGIVCPIGVGAEAVWASVESRKSAKCRAIRSTACERPIHGPPFSQVGSGLLETTRTPGRATWNSRDASHASRTLWLTSPLGRASRSVELVFGLSLLLTARGRRLVPLAATYPVWKYYPPRERPPAWVAGVVAVFQAVGGSIDSRTISGTTSDAALAVLRPGLVGLGFDVEAGKKKVEKIRRPVLFGELGSEDLRMRSMPSTPSSGSHSKSKRGVARVGTPSTAT